MDEPTETPASKRELEILSWLAKLANARQTTPKGDEAALALFAQQLAATNHATKEIVRMLTKFIATPRGEFETAFPALPEMLEALRQQDLADRIETRKQQDRRTQQSQTQTVGGDSLGGLVVTATEWRDWKERHSPEDARKWENIPAYILLGHDDCRNCGGQHFIVRTKTGKIPWAKGVPREESIRTQMLPCPVCRKEKYDALIISHRVS